MKKQRKIKIVERKLGREKADAQVFLDGSQKIEVDPRLGARERLSGICHELLHLAFPKMTEDKILEAEKIMIEGLWDANYREVKNK